MLAQHPRARQLATARTPHRPRRSSEERCDCKCWKWADNLYSTGRVNRKQWHNATKKPYTSAYDLWMREATHLARMGHYYPDQPSNSGGYTTTDARPGTTYHPPQQCIPNYLTEWSWQELWHSTWQSEHRIHVDAADLRPFALGIYSVVVTAYHNGFDRDPTWSVTFTTLPGDRVHYGPYPYDPNYLIVITAGDGTANQHQYNGNDPVGPMGAYSIQFGEYKHLGNWN